MDGLLDAMQWPAVLDAVQWPAMLVTLVAAWLVASQSKGDGCVVASNSLRYAPLSPIKAASADLLTGCIL